MTDDSYSSSYSQQRFPSNMTEEFEPRDLSESKETSLWIGSSRDDLENLTKAFGNAKRDLHFSEDEIIKETLATVGPHEHLDGEIHVKIDSIKQNIGEAVSLRDDVPQKVLDIVQEVVSKATSGNTSSFAADQNMETTNVAYNYGREMARDQFHLTHASQERLDSYDKKLIEVVQCRINAEMEQAETALLECYDLLDEAVEEAENDRKSLQDRLDQESQHPSMDQLNDIYSTAQEELSEERKEYDSILQNCKADIEKIDKSMDSVHVLAGTAKSEFTRKETNRQNELQANREKQEKLQRELMELQSKEKELVRLSHDEKELQEVADAEYREVISRMTDWKEQIASLGRQAETSLDIMERMSDCTEVILNDARDKKRSCESHMATMEVQTLLQLRDTFLAKICLHKMELSDCHDNLKETNNELHRCETEKKKWSQKGFKAKVQMLLEQIRDLESIKEGIEEKIKSHTDSIDEFEKKLIDVDENIKGRNKKIPLDSSHKKYESFHRMMKNVYEKEDITQANFCSNGKYGF